MIVRQYMNERGWRKFNVRDPKKKAFWRTFASKMEGKAVAIDTIIEE